MKVAKLGTGGLPIAVSRVISGPGTAGSFAPLDSGLLVPVSFLPYIEDLATLETDASLVLAPDGAGGVEFRAETGGGALEVDGTPDNVTPVTTLVFADSGSATVTVTDDGGGQATVNVDVAAGGSSVDPIFDVFGAPTTAYEFDTSSLAGLTNRGTLDVQDADTTIPGALFQFSSTGGASWLGLYASQTQPFTAIAKLLDANPSANYGGVGIFAGLATPGFMDVLAVGHGSVIGLELQVFTAPGTYSTSIGPYTVAIPAVIPLYLAIRANSGTSVDYMVSWNGYAWRQVSMGRNPGTVGSVGLVMKRDGGSNLSAMWEYLRIWNTAKTFTGV